MELLRYLLFLFVLLGLLVAGGLFFNGSKAAKYLAAYVLIYALEELDFLYVTGSLLNSFPEFHMMLFPVCLLAGPTLWFHFKHLEKSLPPPKYEYALHLIPFFAYLFFTFYLMSYSPAERLQYVKSIHYSVIMPLNYFKVFHVVFYGGLMLWLVRRKQNQWPLDRRNYLWLLLTIYLLTAVVLTFLTAFNYPYNYFIFYLLTSTMLIWILAYVLYAKPQLLKELQQKYFHSGLKKEDMQRIKGKIQKFMTTSQHIVKRDLNLNQLCQLIEEKKHHVSQTLSKEMQTTFNQLINQHRIAFAKSLLADPKKQDLKILAIAIDSGFTNKSTFNRAFAKYANCTPSQYRSQQQKQGANN